MSDHEEREEDGRRERAEDRADRIYGKEEKPEAPAPTPIYKVPCGRTTGHGTTCAGDQPGWYCAACQEILCQRAELEACEQLGQAAVTSWKHERAKVDRMYQICELAVRANEVVFEDPGDAVRWGEAVNDYEARKP